MLMWNPFRGQDLSLRAFYKRIFRMPTLNDLYYTFIGNRSLAPEYTTQYNLGAIYTLDFATPATPESPRRPASSRLFRRLEIQLDGYFNQVTDKIIAMPTSNQFAWTMINLGYVEILGLDAALQTGLSFGPVEVDTRLGYTYQRARDFTDPADPWYGGQIPYIPLHSGSVVVGGSWRGWTLDYSFLYTGQRWESRANTSENWSPPWYTHDLSLSRTVALARSELRLTAEINNLLNQQYEVVQNYPMPGTNVKLKLTWTL
jgi:outer membrane receptor protein involved in Fe transport